jgi:hypothetical protein
MPAIGGADLYQLGFCLKLPRHIPAYPTPSRHQKIGAALRTAASGGSCRKICHSSLPTIIAYVFGLSKRPANRELESVWDRRRKRVNFRYGNCMSLRKLSRCRLRYPR